MSSTRRAELLIAPSVVTLRGMGEAVSQSLLPVGPWFDPARGIERRRMVREQIVGRGITEPNVIAALSNVARERFVSPAHAHLAYTDRALPAEYGQTISQPYIVALMTDLACVGRGARVLEVGTGSGYQTAVLYALGADVHTIEIVEPFARATQRLLTDLGVHVHTRIGDGHAGWPEAAPFDAIVVTAAPHGVPPALREQLAVGGRLVVPVGDEDQHLFVIRRTEHGFEEQQGLPVRFVPMTGGSFSRATGFGTL